MSNVSPPPPQPETDDGIEYLDYEPRGAALELLDLEAPEVLIEGPAGTGKTRAVMEKLNYLAETVAGLRILICRSTRVSMTESVLVTFETKVLWTGHPAMTGDANRANRHSYDYPNGSTIVVGGLDRPEKLYSTEWDIVYVAECTEITEDAWEKFARAMRNHKLHYQQRIADCNPGAPSHWLNVRASTGHMVRLKSHHEDNPSCTAEYLNGLRALTGHRRARLYEGRWVAAEGGVFPEFSEEKHVVEPFPIPADWPTYLGYDPGYDHPCAIARIAIGPGYVDRKQRDGTIRRMHQLYITGEYVERQKTLPEVARAMHELETGCRVVKKLGDPHDAFKHTQGSNGRTIADQLKDLGHQLIEAPAANSREELIAQVELMRDYLITTTPGGKPLLRIFRGTAPKIVNAFQSWSYKRTAQGELTGALDQFEEEWKDECDSVRQIVAGTPRYGRKEDATCSISGR